MESARQVIEELESRRIDKVKNAVASIIGRDEPERFAKEVYASEIPAQQLTDYQRSIILRHAKRHRETRP